MYNVEELLKAQPSFRQRSNKNRGIAYLLIKKFNLDIRADLLEDVIVQASTMDRTWRKLLAENVNYRGTDYGDKDAIEAEKMIALGYAITKKYD